jgi:hypothetical protein
MKFPNTLQLFLLIFNLVILDFSKIQKFLAGKIFLRGMQLQVQESTIITINVQLSTIIVTIVVIVTIIVDNCTLIVKMIDSCTIVLVVASPLKNLLWQFKFPAKIKGKFKEH